MKFKLPQPESVKTKTLIEATQINLLKCKKKISEPSFKWKSKPAAIFAYPCMLSQQWNFS